MCRLRNIAMPDYQESVTTGQTHRRTPDPYVPLCFAGDTIKLDAKVETWLCCLRNLMKYSSLPFQEEHLKCLTRRVIRMR